MERLRDSISQPWIRRPWRPSVNGSAPAAFSSFSSTSTSIFLLTDSPGFPLLLFFLLPSLRVFVLASLFYCGASTTWAGLLNKTRTLELILPQNFFQVWVNGLYNFYFYLFFINTTICPYIRNVRLNASFSFLSGIFLKIIVCQGFLTPQQKKIKTFL